MDNLEITSFLEIQGYAWPFDKNYKLFFGWLIINVIIFRCIYVFSECLMFHVLYPEGCSLFRYQTYTEDRISNESEH